MAQILTDYQLSLRSAAWIDTNTLLTINELPDRLSDVQSVMYSSVFNLLNCPPGARGRLFEPEYGAMLYQFLQEPVDEQTSAAMRLALIQALQRWEPRIQLDMANTYLTPDTSIPGYHVRITAKFLLTNDTDSITFAMRTINNG